jgi:hypothetical protein
MNLGAILVGGVIGSILTLICRYFYDLKVQPKIEKSRKRAEKLESEREEEAKMASRDQELLRRNDIRTLRGMKELLEPMASLFKFSDSCDPQACYSYLRTIRRRAELIKRPEFQDIREKLLKFSDKKDGLNSSLARNELLNIISGKYDVLQPQDLINEIDTILNGAQ